MNQHDGLHLMEVQANYTLDENCLMALPRGEPFQKFSKAKDKPRPKRGFGNSFQPAIDAPRLEPH
ncbi:hypothetical protein MTR_4g098835 [Medicago truncatula]|uniref:Uncharacterized protein n=1 Tax=Medicago truncatula TaxID=3880 RepID=A0A072UQC1_MEDTR|nr:hypothetical protein MTR_4g098835 [Medicago truncatula]